MADSRVLTFHYTLRDASGRVLDTSRGAEPLTCIEGAGQIVPGLEKALRAMQPGERREVVVSAEEGYGLRRDDLIGRVPRANLPFDGEVRVGDQFQTGPDPRHAPIVRVIALEGADVVLDANHPLAGRELRFDVELAAARPATSAELMSARAAAGD
ncbi:MAG: peptidylprolyl isomerase [Opitutus sp.]|nr:peptidylprolyl isomerase [Opitutus sp.]